MNFFTKKNNTNSFFPIKVDIHSHLLPNIDDGVKSFEDSIFCINGLVERGIKKIIVTPHVSHNYFNNSSESIKDSFVFLLQEVKGRNIDVELELGAEYQIDEAFEKKLQLGDLLSFGNKYVLIEFSYHSPPPDLNSIIYELSVAGYNIILAHPERYEYYHNNLKLYEDLKNRDVLFQLNIVSLSNFYNNNIRKIGEKLIKNGLIDFIGTDIHSKKYFNFLDNALKKKYFAALLKSDKLKNNMLL